jgi:hypothetical protein
VVSSSAADTGRRAQSGLAPIGLFPASHGGDCAATAAGTGTGIGAGPGESGPHGPGESWPDMPEESWPSGLGGSWPDGPGGSWPDEPEAYWPARGRSPGRTLVIVAAAAVVIVALVGAAFLVLRGSGPAPARHAAYVAAINHRHYAKAWRLGGRNSSASYKNFVRGFGTTAKDTLTILSVSGYVMTARLTAVQTDGSLQVYVGTYTVDNGVITTSNIDRIS